MNQSEAVAEIKFLRCLVRDLVEQACGEEKGKMFSGFISTYSDAMRWLNEWGMTKGFDDRGMGVVYTNVKDSFGAYPEDAQVVTVEEQGGRPPDAAGK